MSKYNLEHHKVIESALKHFNADFFCENNIIFGGGTRIALELDEYRESIDIDFLCPNRLSYRAIRTQVTNKTLGLAVHEDFQYTREIRADRDGIRTVVHVEDSDIKLEFISFDQYDLELEVNKDLFPIPFLSRNSCFYTKLLANADRALSPPHKDIFDILAMYKAWGSIPESAMYSAENHYGDDIKNKLIAALEDMINHPKKYEIHAKSIKMKANWMNDIIYTQADKLLAELTKS
ncbi:nucleotidyl transferase AbiEii/AbiGii toxin family protein [Moritella viscosa]|uniref:Nucleotidyl transferase AbiEii/AbiGii toxin family protein n=1 Tax=Moritella viscosa TaxID=80854 RepID=A0A1L0BEM6_9GAMM|nr:nucleotidyl transferase AbiEii/AbiGii toxin family protein [Moritella viscosa]SGY96135.1 Putative uncharacterized protein [Moritella viscosa]SHO06915.1 Putative uncharacterized protein [Moritella viscosa]